MVGAVSVVWRWQLTLDTELAIHWGDTAHTLRQEIGQVTRHD